MTSPQQQPPDAMTAQILVEIGKLSTQLAVITEQLKQLPDHESRIRALERFRFTLMGAVVAISASFSALGAWIAHTISGR